MLRITRDSSSQSGITVDKLLLLFTQKLLFGEGAALRVLDFFLLTRANAFIFDNSPCHHDRPYFVGPILLLDDKIGPLLEYISSIGLLWTEDDLGSRMWTIGPKNGY